MDFPEWTPGYVVEQYLSLVHGEELFGKTNYTISELTVHANKKGYPNWPSLQGFLVALRESIYRLANDAGGKSVFQWLGSDEAVRALLREIRLGLDEWYRQPRMTTSEYSSNYADIADLAIRLAGKLSVHFGDANLPKSLSALTSGDYREIAICAIHPELAARAKAKGAPLGAYVGAGLPPLHVMLYELAEKAKAAMPPSYIAKKAHNNSALRQIFVKRVCFIGYQFNLKRSSGAIANVVSLVMGDACISDATIRGDMKGKDWWPKDWEQ